MSNESRSEMRGHLKVDNLKFQLGNLDQRFAEAHLDTVVYMLLTDLKEGKLEVGQLRSIYELVKDCMSDRDTLMNNPELSSLERDLGFFLEGLEYARMQMEKVLK